MLASTSIRAYRASISSPARRTSLRRDISANKTSTWASGAAASLFCRSRLTLSREKVLQVLERDGPLRQASLAKSLRLAPRSITQSIEGLERSGLVERRPDPDDQRCKLVLLTPKGHATLTTGMEAGQRVLRSIFGALEPDRQADLDILLTDIEAAQTEVSRRLRR